MPSHCMQHDCACACEKIVYVYETDKERETRLRQIEKEKKEKKEQERERILRQIADLEKELIQLKAILPQGESDDRG